MSTINTRNCSLIRLCKLSRLSRGQSQYRNAMFPIPIQGFEAQPIGFIRPRTNVLAPMDKLKRVNYKSQRKTRKLKQVHARKSQFNRILVFFQLN